MTEKLRQKSGPKRLQTRRHLSKQINLSFFQNGGKIASSSNDGTIRLWDAESATCVGISPKIGSETRGVSFSGDGDRIVSGSVDGIVRIWNARLQTESKRKIYGHFLSGDCRCDQSRWDAGVFRIG